MPNRAIEFHDSRLDGISTDSSAVVFHFPAAYINQSAGEPGWDTGSGWVQEARLHIADAQVTGSLAELPCDLWQGERRLDGKLFQMLPIPLEHGGTVQLDLECVGSMRVSGTAIRAWNCFMSRCTLRRFRAIRASNCCEIAFTQLTVR